MSAFTRLLLWHGQKRRIFWVCGAGVQDGCVVTVFKPPWLNIHPSGLLVSSNKGEAAEKLGVHHHQFGEDHLMLQKNPKSPDYKHKVTRKALWVDGWSTPPWVKAVLKLVAQGKLQSHVGHHTSDSQETTQPNRLLKCDVGRRNALPANARRLRQTVQQVGNVRMHIQSAKTMSEAVVVLKNGLQRGIAIDSYTYVEVLSGV